MRVLNTSINNSNQELLYSFTNGVEIDSLLFKQEIQVQKSWVKALKSIDVLSSEEEQEVLSELNNIHSLMEKKEFKWSIFDEDIHMNIERHLTENLGELGKKIHLGRSRNDLIATTLRLYTRDILQDLSNLLSAFVEEVRDKADEWKGFTVPGLTHVQAGMPVCLGLVFSAHKEAAVRDLTRVSNAQKSCMDYCPLGSAAFAGTHLDLDLLKISKSLSFKGSVKNSYDAVGDRDFILEALNCFSVTGVHLSRMCEELIYFSSAFVGVFKLPPDLSTGSSIMPNKRNPDVLELVRAKMSKVISSSSEGANLVRAVLPSYGSDLHELKETLERSKKELFSSIEILTPFVKGLTLDSGKAKELCKAGHILATDITNFYCHSGMSFRDAYVRVASLVEEANTQQKQIHQVLSSREEPEFWLYLKERRGFDKNCFVSS